MKKVLLSLTLLLSCKESSNPADDLAKTTETRTSDDTSLVVAHINTFKTDVNLCMLSQVYNKCDLWDAQLTKFTSNDYFLSVTIRRRAIKNEEMHFDFVTSTQFAHQRADKWIVFPINPYDPLHDEIYGYFFLFNPDLNHGSIVIDNALPKNSISKEDVVIGLNLTTSDKVGVGIK